MKIAYILHIFPRLYNTFILNDITHLVEQGHEVYIYSLGRSNEKVINQGVNDLMDKVFYFDDFIIENNIIFRNYLKMIVNKVRRFKKMYANMSGILFKKTSSFNTIKKYFPEFQWRSYAFESIASKLIKDKINIIHAAFGNNVTTAAMLLSELTKIPFTFETHAMDLFVDFRFPEEKILKASKLFTISNYNKNYLVNRFKCPSSKVCVKRVSFNNGYCDRIIDVTKQRSLIVSVCRLEPIKGLEYAIEAFKLVSYNMNDIQYVIIGDGPMKEELINMVNRYSLGDKITFLGNVKNEEALDLIAQATIVLLPSVIGPNGDRDGIPTTLIESMYMKTPVISSRVSGIPELIDDGVNGYLTEPGDVKQITQRMELLLLNESLRNRMGTSAREKVLNEFNIDTGVNKMIVVWNEMLTH